jgi:enoyl-CoA hydratase/carnithine racemase
MEKRKMTYVYTRYEVENHIGLVTLNRPDHLNAFTEDMREELLDIFRKADLDDGVRVVVVTGAGNAFCAGADLSAGGSRWDNTVDQGSNVKISEHRDGGGRVALAVFNCRKPVIAAINGAAVGIGITMTLPMDIRIAAEDAKVGFVFSRRGVVPEACSSWFLPRIVGINKASEWVLTGRIFKVRDESRSGLFNYVLPREQVLSKAMEIAGEIVQHTAPVSVALSKALLWHGLSEKDPQSAHLIESRVFFWAGSHPDAYEGIKSFLEKRPPAFPLKVSKDMPDFYPWWKEPKV